MRATDPAAPVPRATVPTVTVTATTTATGPTTTPTGNPSTGPTITTTAGPIAGPVAEQAADPTAVRSPDEPDLDRLPPPAGPGPQGVVELRASTRRVTRTARARNSLSSLVVVRAWPDPLLDRVGHDPRDAYAETFWLPIIGPSGLLLLRRLVRAIEEVRHDPAGPVPEPGEPAVAVTDLAAALGMGSSRGPSGAFYRTVDRLVSFGFAHLVDDATLAVRTHLPPLTRRQLKRLPASLHDEHERWSSEQAAARNPSTEHMTRRARALALSLLELGEDRAGAERQLHRWQFHPAIAHEAIRWAALEYDRRRPPPAVPA